MDHRQCSSWRARLGCGIAAAILACAGPARAATSCVSVRAQSYIPLLRAFARVTPIADASVRAGLDGRLVHLDVVPGTRVRAGQRIGMLGGSQVRALLASDRARLEAARSEEQERSAALAIQRQRLAQHLSTRERVGSAISDLARARALRVGAQQDLDADPRPGRPCAPASGAVIAVQADAGERVRTGQVLVRVQPQDGLWLLAAIYDPHARAQLHVGMQGSFQPDDGSHASAVHIVQLPPRLRADGGQPVALARESKSAAQGWIDGETGTLVLKGRVEQRILVPTRALVLNRGLWWVLLDTAHGERQQQVTPGARVGNLSVIVHGLEPGEKVVVDHVYRHFHSGINHHYQIQD